MLLFLAALSFFFAGVSNRESSSTIRFLANHHQCGRQRMKKITRLTEMPMMSRIVSSAMEYELISGASVHVRAVKAQ